jgi:exodeoxyribonuclease VII large subunit
MTTPDHLAPIRLSQLAGEVTRVIDQVFNKQSFWVIADVANHSYKSASGHHYFDLVEKDKTSSALTAKIPTRAWGEGSLFIMNFEAATGQRFSNDLNVLVQISVFYHPVYGLQLTLLNIDTSFTLGALEKQKRETLLRLVRDNAEYIRLEKGAYITFNQELVLPLAIQTIAVISSSTSAGMEDFAHTLQNNNFNYWFRIDPYYSTVQGELNAQAIVDQLIAIYNSKIAYDVVVLIRGGGSQTDLLLFEQYVIGRAIARFPIPIITGIDHQKNETVADLMAHTTVKTPTKAAEMILAHNRAFADELSSLEKSIIIRSQQLLARQHQALATANQRLTGAATQYLNSQHQQLQALASGLLRKPGLILYEKQRDLENITDQLKRESNYYLKNQHQSLDNFRVLISLLSPENVLKKGFALVKKEGRILSSADTITTGDELAVILAGQEIHTTVIQKNNYDGKDFNL